MRVQRLFPLTLLITAVLWLTPPVEAANCGPGQTNTTCQCGDTVTANYTMAADLTCSTTTDGLYVATGKTLDCAGFTITGNGITNNRAGIRNTGVANTQTIENCTITNFQWGMYLQNGYSSVLRDNETYGNGIGVLISNSTTYDVAIDGLQTHDNADEGLKIDTTSTTTVNRPPMTLSRISAYDNGSYGIHLNAAPFLTMSRFTTWNNCDTDCVGVYVHDSADITVTDGDLKDFDKLYLFGNADGGAYSYLRLAGGQVVIKKDSTKVPQNNTFSNVMVDTVVPSGTAILFDGVTTGNNAFSNSAGTGLVAQHSVKAINTSTGNSVTNLFVNPASAATTSVESGSSFTTLSTQSTTVPGITTSNTVNVNAQANGGCGYVIPANTTAVLTADLDCSSYSDFGKASWLAARNCMPESSGVSEVCAIQFGSSNSILSCNGYKIKGPWTPTWSPYRFENPPVAGGNYYTPTGWSGDPGMNVNGIVGGYQALARSGLAVLGCKVEGWLMGARFANVNRVEIRSDFYQNRKYGFDLHGGGENRGTMYPTATDPELTTTYDVLFASSSFHENGDEGIHISGTNRLLGTGKVTTLSSAHTSNGSNSYMLTVASTSGFAGTATWNGSACSSTGTPGQAWLTYGQYGPQPFSYRCKDSTHFYGVSALPNTSSNLTQQVAWVLDLGSAASGTKIQQRTPVRIEPSFHYGGSYAGEIDINWGAGTMYNVNEGIYLLKAHGVQIRTHDVAWNGGSGIYVKNSKDVGIQGIVSGPAFSGNETPTLMEMWGYNPIDIIGSSSVRIGRPGGVLLEGARLRLKSCTSSDDAVNCAATQIPAGNTIDGLKILGESHDERLCDPDCPPSAATGVPGEAIMFDGVVNPSPGNTVTDHTCTFMNGIGFGVKSVNGSTGNNVVSSYSTGSDSGNPGTINHSGTCYWP